MARFWEFASSVFLSWDSLMGGVVSAAILGVLAFVYKKRYPRTKGLPWYYFVIVALVFAFVASYFAWQEKDGVLTEAIQARYAAEMQLRQREAQLVGGYYNAYCYNSGPMLLAVLVHLKNIERRLGSVYRKGTDLFS